MSVLITLGTPNVVVPLPPGQMSSPVSGSRYARYTAGNAERNRGMPSAKLYPVGRYFPGQMISSPGLRRITGDTTHSEESAFQVKRTCMSSFKWLSLLRTTEDTGPAPLAG